MVAEEALWNIASTTKPTTNKQSSLEELHRLNITLSNYFDVTPTIGITTLSTTSESKTTEQSNNNIDIIV